MHARRLFFLILISVVATASARGAGSFKLESIVLYQTDEPLESRLSYTEALSIYIKRLSAACTEFFASEKTPERLDIVVGIKPEQKVRVWFVSSRRNSQDKSLVDLRKKLEAIESCRVHDGPVAFALRCTIAGGGAGKADGELPMPKEWRDAGPNISVPDGIFERIWRD